jgi:uncharacterized protein (DUF697 family)
MSQKKRLPRAITKTADEMKAAGTAAPEPVNAPLKSEPSAADPLDARSIAIVNDVQRLSEARAIVERYGNAASFGGLIPLPLINVAGVTAIILRMIKLLCKVYGVPYDQGRARAIAVSLAAGALPSTASAVTASTLIYFVPGANLLGLAVSSVAASVCARTVGYRFVQHFETGATLLNFPVVERRRS